MRAQSRSTGAFRVLMAGAGTFGYWNAGDEAIFSAMLADLRAVESRLEVTLISQNPAGTMTRYGVREISPQDLGGMIDAARASDLMILGGGGLFYDYWGVDTDAILTPNHVGLAFYSSFALLAAILNKSLMIYAAGVGPILTDAGKRITRAIFDQAQAATVRDIESRRVLRSLGVHTARVRVTADPAFSIEPVPILGEDAKVVEAVAARPLLGVAARAWDVNVRPGAWEDEVAGALDMFVHRFGGTVVFVPFHRPGAGPLTNDAELARRIRERMRHSDRSTIAPADLVPEEKAWVLSRCDVMLGMRLHSLMSAATSGVPLVALAYDPKIVSLCRRIGCGKYVVDLSDLQATQLVDLLAQAYRRTGRLRKLIKPKVKRLQQLAAENARIAMRLRSISPATTSRFSPYMAELVKQVSLAQVVRAHGLSRATPVPRETTVEGDRVLEAQAVKREEAITALREKLAERERQLQTLRDTARDQEAAIGALQRELAARPEQWQQPEAEMRDKRATLSSLYEEVLTKDQRIAALEAQFGEQQREVQRLHDLIQGITRSTGWSLLQVLWRIRLWLIPRGSIRERVIARIMQIFRRRVRGIPHAVVPGDQPAEAVPQRPPDVRRILRFIYRRLPDSVRSTAYRAYLDLTARAQRAEIPPPVAAPRMAETPQLPKPSLQRGVIAMPGGSTKLVNMLTPLFFDHDGREMMRGGAERYVLQLAPLVESFGYRVRVFQSARGSWSRSYGCVRVDGIDTGGDVGKLNERFHALAPDGVLTIYLAFYLATPHYIPGSIGISHGIYWDHPGMQHPEAVYNEKVGQVLSAIRNLARVVSVDTNMINWVRATNAALAERFLYVPNFVDLSQFRPAASRHDGRLVVLYPRRLYAPRGFWLAAEVLPDVLASFNDVEFHFVGQADSAEEHAMEDLMKTYPGRVRWYSLPPEMMHEAYQTAAITIIPTLFAEGTSLACLEAQASGNAVIATNVGGLPDLILDRHNGLLIEPSAEALRTALTRLITDEPLRGRLVTNAVEVARNYGLPRWEARWRTLLAEHLPARRSPRTSAGETHHPTVVFPATPGMSWGRMKQRPHHLAEQLARHGVKTYWVDPDGTRTEPIKHLLVIPSSDFEPPEGSVVVIYYPYLAEELQRYVDPFVIYDVVDDISIHDRSDELHSVPSGRRARDYHNYLLARADIVLTASRGLFNQLQDRRSDVVYVPNGVDFTRFAEPPREVPADLPRAAGALIGYHGALGPWFDYDLLSLVAGHRPDDQFVLIGPVSDQARLQAALRRTSNIHYLGEKPYEELPAYVGAFDAAIIPFLVDTITRAVRPLKVLECLAMAKPVVSVPLPELEGWPGVFFARHPEELAEALDAAIQAGQDAEIKAQMKAFAREASWETAVQPLAFKILDRCRLGLQACSTMRISS